MADEIELKFALADEAAYARWTDLRALDARYTVTPAAEPQIAIIDTYLDTADHRFLRHGYALRQRCAGSRVLLTLKALAAAPETGRAHSLHRRREVEVALDTPAASTDPAQWPAVVRAEVAPLLTDDMELQPCAVVRQERAKRIVTRHPEQAAPDAPDETAYAPLRAELSVDRVAIVAPCDGKVVARRYELEVELLTGSEDELRAIADLIAADETLAAQARSKFEDARLTLARYVPAPDAADAPPQLGITPDMAMAEAARLILHEQFVDMLRNEPGVRADDDIEYVHDMRVATRRARVTLDVFGPYLKRKRVKYIAKRMRKTGKLLGAVRDLDVALHNATSTASSPGDKDPALKQWRKQRKVAFNALLTWLDSKKYATFVRRMDRFVTTPGLGAVTWTHHPGERPAATQVRHVMPVLLTAQFAAIRSYETLLADAKPVDYATIHRLRIDAKYLRYELEFVRDLLGRDGEVLIKRLKKLQDHLGALNDAVVAGALLQETRGGRSESDDADDERAEQAGADLLDHQQALVDELTAATPVILARFCSKKNRRRLGRAVAQL
ncbi:MAG: CHAD domain-containing protein [Caldilineaceae bacterium]|nr:CHAD domain-containing protein [Caldilineaceae bacterium]